MSIPREARSLATQIETLNCVYVSFVAYALGVKPPCIMPTLIPKQRLSEFASSSALSLLLQKTIHRYGFKISIN